MKNNDIIKQIAYLTHQPEWVNDPKLVKKVQYLGKKIMGENRKGRTKKMIAVYKNGDLLVKGYSSELTQTLGFSASTIRNYARTQRTDDQKRTYGYVGVQK